VTCSVDAACRERWWLTKESGRVPSRGTGCVVHAGSGTEDLRRPYMVMEIESVHRRGWTVLMARLSGETVRIVEEIAFTLRGQVPGRCADWEADRASLVCKLYSGAFSSGVQCACVRGCEMASDGWSVCDECAVGADYKRRFVWYDSFPGVFPLGRTHWLAGPTDGLSAACSVWWCAFRGAVCGLSVEFCAMCSSPSSTQ
jgi:hypothetical protein